MNYELMYTQSQTIKCKAAVAWELGKPVTVEEVEVAPPKQGEVRVKVVANGLCHSDLSALNWPNFAVFPVILGHEGSGIVESVGEGVTEFKPGDHVIPLFFPQCYECDYCKSPRTNWCLKLAATKVHSIVL